MYVVDYMVGFRPYRCGQFTGVIYTIFYVLGSTKKIEKAGLSTFLPTIHFDRDGQTDDVGWAASIRSSITAMSLRGKDDGQKWR